MFVGVLKLTFFIPEARSLKDKRAVLRRFRDRVRSQFPVSVAEVGGLDLHQRAVFGVSVVSGTAATCDSILSKVAHFAGTQPEAVLTDRQMEIMSFGEDLFGGTQGPARL